MNARVFLDLETIPTTSPEEMARIAEEVRTLTRIRANHERVLTIVGTPRDEVPA